MTEFFINDGGTPKNIYNYDFNNIDEFENDIKNSYGINLKFLFIESEHNKITYPDYINNYGPWKVLYKNYVLYNKIHNELCLNNENIIIRLRPDIVITNPLILNNIIYGFKNSKKTTFIWYMLKTRFFFDFLRSKRPILYQVYRT